MKFKTHKTHNGVIRRLSTRVGGLGVVVAIFTAFIMDPSVSLASSNAQTFTYQGRFMNDTGSAPLTGLIDITFSVFDPSVSCLLYQETQTNIDLTSTAGIFAAQVGSAVGSGKRTGNDPALSMAQVFSNNLEIRHSGTPNCAPGYTPAAGDSRVLRVTVTPHSTGVPTTISPDQMINSVPQSQTAETLQGLTPSGFVQSASGVAGQGNVSLATLQSLTNGSDASTLHNHDSVYVKIGAVGASANLGTSAYTTGDLGIGTSTLTGNLSFGGSSGTQTITVNRDTVANQPGSTLSLSAGGATLAGTNQNGGNLVLSSGTSTGTGNSSIQFKTSGSGGAGSGDNAPATKMVLSSSGFLGIGAVNPGAQLEVDTSGAAVLGEILKATAGQTADLLEVQASNGSVLSKIDAAGYLTLPGSPTSNLQAATKQYVDSAISSIPAGGVTSFDTRTGAITLSSADVTGALTYTPLKNSTDTMTGTLTINQVLGVGGAASANTQMQSTSTVATNVTAVLKEAASQTADMLEFQDSTGAVLSKVDSTGILTLQGPPTSGLQAATKNYVDTAIAGATAGVATFNTRNGAVTLQTSDVTGVLGSGLPVVNGGTGLVAGTSGGIPYYASSSTMASSAALTANGLILGGGSGASPTSLAVGTSGQLLNSQGAAAPAWTSSPTISGTLGVGGAIGANTQLQSTSTTATNVTGVLKGAAAQSADLLDFESSTGVVLSKFDSAGMLTLAGAPTSNLQAATKAYVDSAVSGVGGFLPLAGGTLTGALTGTSVTTSGNVVDGGTLSVAGTSSLGTGSTNSFSISGSATSPTLTVAGAGADVDLKIAPKGNGQVLVGNGGWSYTTASSGAGSLFLSNGSNDSPNIKWAYGNNSNFSMDTANTPITGTSGQVMRFIKQADEAGGTVLGAFDTSGNFAATGNATFGSNAVVSGSGTSYFNGGSVGIGNTAPGSALDVSGALTERGMAAPAVSSAGQGIMYFDSTAHVFEISQNGSAYSPIATTATTGSYLPLAGGTLTGGLSGTTIATSGDITDSGNLSVTGTSTLSGNSTVGGTFGVTGATTLGSTLAVTGATTLTGNLTEAGSITQNGMAAPAVSAAGNGAIYFDSTAHVFEVSQNGGAYSPLATAASIGSTYLPLAGGTLTGGLSGTTLATSGNITDSGNLSVTGTSTLTGNSTVGGTFGVTGATTLNSTLAVTGATTLTGNTTESGTLGVGGAIGANTQLQSTSTSATNATAVLKEAASQSADILDLENSSGTVLSKFDSAGMLTLKADPTSGLQAATKSYVDAAVGSATVNWAVPGTIGSTTPNTGAFTTLKSTSLEVDNSTAGTDTITVKQTVGTAGNYYANLLFENTVGTIANFSATGAGYPAGNIWGANDFVLLGGQGNASTNMIFLTNTTGAIKFGTGGYAQSNERMRITPAGNVGIGTTTPGTGTALNVVGQVATSSSTTTGASIDFSLGNAAMTSYDCAGGNLSFVNMRDGGAYTVAVSSATTAQCNFTAATTGDDAATVTYRFLPANAARIASTYTLYSLQRIGTVVFVSWQTGF